MLVVVVGATGQQAGRQAVPHAPKRRSRRVLVRKIVWKRSILEQMNNGLVYCPRLGSRRPRARRPIIWSFVIAKTPIIRYSIVYILSSLGIAICNLMTEGGRRHDRKF